jgi:formylglycine-generating enzyme required for sulfatase activity
MILVDGEYCPVVRQDCVRWLEDPNVFSYARCAEYDTIPICLAPRQHKRFCIDRDEYTPPGDELPATHQSWKAARQICQDQGKRLCQESEWEFACEGEGLLPYPYGLVRDPSLCNFDQQDLYKPDGSLRDMREPVGARPRCESPFGVRNMVGNVDEWTVRDATPGPHRSALRGGWWMAARSRCRAATTAHNETYEGPQTGVRCCADPTRVEP